MPAIYYLDKARGAWDAVCFECQPEPGGAPLPLASGVDAVTASDARDAHNRKAHGG